MKVYGSTLDDIQIGITVLLVIMMIFFLVSLLAEKWFKDHMQHLRGVLYLCSVVAVGIYFFHFETKAQWTFVGMIVSVFVFMDLFLFQRPRVKKIWGAEFEEVAVKEVEQSVIDLRSQLVSSGEKSLVLSNIIGMIDKNVFHDIKWSDINSYVSSLESILREYAKHCFQTVDVIDYSDSSQFKSQVRTLGVEITEEHTSVLDKREVALIGDDTALVPSPSGVSRPIVVLVKQEKGNLQEADFANIQSLVILHSYFEV